MAHNLLQTPRFLTSEAFLPRVTHHDGRVQPTRLNPTHDSIEKLVQYVRLLKRLVDAGLPVIAGRVGAFGLVQQALGIQVFDSGLGGAERFDLASLNRGKPATGEDDKKPKGGRGDRRIYFERLKTTLPGRHARALLADPVLRSHVVCSLECCQYRGFAELPDRRRQHYLWVRYKEVADLASHSTEELKLHHIHERLADAIDTASVIRRALERAGGGVPDFDHLERWVAVLSRMTEPVAAREGG